MQPPHRKTPQVEAAAEFQADLEALRRQMNQMQLALAQQTNERPLSIWEERAPAARAMVLDPGADARKLAGAINVLQLARDRTPDIVDRLLRDFRTFEDRFVQMETLSYLTNAPANPEVGKLLASVLENEAGEFDPMVRERAVTVTLGQLPDANARAWLEWIATNDSNENLRSKAHYGLVHNDLNSHL